MNKAQLAILLGETKSFADKDDTASDEADNFENLLFDEKVKRKFNSLAIGVATYNGMQDVFCLDTLVSHPDGDRELEESETLKSLPDIRYCISPGLKMFKNIYGAVKPVLLQYLYNDVTRLVMEYTTDLLDKKVIINQCKVCGEDVDIINVDWFIDSESISVLYPKEACYKHRCSIVDERGPCPFVGNIDFKEYQHLSDINYKYQRAKSDEFLPQDPNDPSFTVKLHYDMICTHHYGRFLKSRCLDINCQEVAINSKGWCLLHLGDKRLICPEPSCNKIVNKCTDHACSRGICNLARVSGKIYCCKDACPVTDCNEIMRCDKHCCAKCENLKIQDGRYCQSHLESKTCLYGDCNYGECDTAKLEGKDYCIKHKCPNCDNDNRCSIHHCNIVYCYNVINDGQKYCSQHKCLLCDNPVMFNQRHCADHNCSYRFCNQAIEPNSKFCRAHIGLSTNRHNVVRTVDDLFTTCTNTQTYPNDIDSIMTNTICHGTISNVTDIGLTTLDNLPTEINQDRTLVENSNQSRNNTLTNNQVNLINNLNNMFRTIAQEMVEHKDIDKCVIS